MNPKKVERGENVLSAIRHKAEQKAIRAHSGESAPVSEAGKTCYPQQPRYWTAGRRTITCQMTRFWSGMHHATFQPSIKDPILTGALTQMNLVSIAAHSESPFSTDTI